MPYWNDKKYETYAEIRDKYGLTDGGAISHIEKCLEDKCLYAYIKNHTDTKLEKYNYTMLPRENVLLAFGNNDALDGCYFDADFIMFFKEELSSCDLVLCMDVMLPQEERPANQIAPLQNETPPKTRGKRQTVSRPEMAGYCGVSKSTIKNWENGKGTPQDYPGRSSRTNAIVWGASYKQTQAMKQERKALKNASTGHDVDKHSKGYYDQ